MKINLGTEYKKIAETPVGEVIAKGTYVGLGEDKFGNPTVLLRGEDGSDICVNSCGGLTKRIAKGLAMRVIKENVSFLTLTRLESGIIKKGPFAGKEAHSVDVDVDEVKEETTDHGIDL